MPVRTPDPYDQINGGDNPRPADGIGRWVYWGRSFKAAFSESRDSSVANPPFKSTIGPSNHTWAASGDGTADNKLELNDDDGALWGADPSGQVHFRMNDGWQGKFYIRTENADYFEDNVQNAWVTDNWGDDWGDNLEDIDNLLEGGGYPRVWIQDNAEYWTDSRTVFVMGGNDYLSVDIDSESDSIAQFRVNLDGENYFVNTEINDEVVIVPLWLRYWDATYVWPPEGGGGGGGGGNTIDCGVGYRWDEETETCVREDNPLTPEEKCNAKDGYTWNAETQTCDLDSNGGDDEFPETSILLIGLAIATVLIISFKVARGGA